MLENFSKKKIIILTAVAVILISVAVLVYIFVLKDKNTEVDNGQMIDKNALENKFNLDIFKEEAFQELKDTPRLNTSTSENLGKENPFLEF